MHFLRNERKRREQERKKRERERMRPWLQVLCWASVIEGIWKSPEANPFHSSWGPKKFKRVIYSKCVPCRAKQM